MRISERKTKKNLKPVHPSLQQRFAMSCGRLYAALSLKRLYGFSCDPVTVSEPFIFVSNHTTDRDLLFSMLSVKNYMYYVLSEHLMRRSAFMNWVVKRFRLVPVFKGSVAGTSVRGILRLLRDGNNVCLFPEGGHSLDGRTNGFSASTGKMIKSAHCALVTFRTHGGYFVKPRWAKKWRRGPVSADRVKVYSSALLSEKTPEEINEIIRRDIAVDAYAEQKSLQAAYPGPDLAEGIENIFYLCPVCGAAERITSEGSRFRCEACGAEGTIDVYGMLSGDFPYRTVAEWSDWEMEETAKRFAEGRLVSHAENVRFLEILQNHRENTLAQGSVTADCEGLTACGRTFLYTEIEAMEYIDQCNTLLFSSAGHFFSLEADYLDGVLIRRLYILRSRKAAAEDGKKFDDAK